MDLHHLMRSLRLAAAGPFLALGLVTTTQGKDVVSLDEVVAAVEAYNLEIQAARTGARADAQRLDQVTWPYPMVEAMFMPWMISEGQVGVQLQASQAIPWGDRLRAEREARRFMAEASDYEVDALLRERVMQARTAYAGLWALEEQRRLLDDFGLRVSFFEEVAHLQYQTARGEQRQILRVEIESEMLAQRLDVIERDASELRERLAVLTGRRINIGPADRLEAPEMPTHASMAALWAQIQQDHPELAANRAMERSEAAMVRANRAMGRPEFTVGMGVNLTPMARRRMYGLEPVTPMVGVMLPLWRGGIRASVREAELRRDQRELETEHTRIELMSALHETLHHLDRLGSRISRYERALRPRAELVLESTTTGYQTGRAPFIDLLDAYRMLFDVETSLVEARAEHAMMFARLQALVGR